ncbi:MAG: M16 family metallopeptidase, partial [Spirochaeta sp.]
REIAASDARDEIDDELMPVLPEPGEVVETRHHEEVQTREWTLSNGITVLVRPTDFRSDEIRMQAYQKGGNSVVDTGDIYSAAFAAPVAQQSGIAHLTKIQLDQHLAGREVQVSPFIHEYTHGFSGSSSTDDLEMMLQLVHLYTVSPRIDEESYDFLMRQVQANLERRENQPDAVFADTLQSIIANDNPRMEPLRLSDLDRVDFETVRQTYLDTFADLSDTVFVFVGSIDPETMQPLTEQYLGSLPTGIQDTQRIPHPIDPPAGITSEEIYFGQEDSSRIAIVFTGDYDGSPESEYALTALRDVLRIQLRETIREEEGGTYGVQVSSSSQSYPDNHYQISIVFNTDPIRAEELTRRIHNEIAYIQENGPGDDILQRVQETHRRDYESSMRSNSWWLNNLRSARYRNESLDQFLDRADLIEELSPEMLIQAARNMLPQDEYIQLLMYPQDN